MEWFVRRDGESFGPFAFTDLLNGARSGELRTDDLVWRTGTEAWVPAGSMSELWDHSRPLKVRKPIFLIPGWVFLAFFVGPNLMLMVVLIFFRGPARLSLVEWIRETITLSP